MWWGGQRPGCRPGSVIVPKSEYVLFPHWFVFNFRGHGNGLPWICGRGSLLSSVSFSVELLAYKLEQEKQIAADLQRTLKEEQEKACSTRKLLAGEQTAGRDLRAELRECKQDNERLLASLGEAQKEVLRLR